MWRKDGPSEPLLLPLKPEARVVYNSDLTIDDPAETTSLCVFYDQVLLPYTNMASSLQLMRLDKNGREVEVASEASNDIANWDEKYRELFTAGALRRLGEGPKLQFQVKEEDEDFETIRIWQGIDSIQSLQRGDTVAGTGLGRFFVRAVETRQGVTEDEYETRRYIEVRRKKPNPRKATIAFKSGDLRTLENIRYYKAAGNKKRYVRTDLVRHILRGDITLPQIFASRDWRSKREMLVALEAQAAFEFLIPKITAVSPDQILALRDAVKDTRAGFADHLVTLSVGLEQRLKAQSSSKEILDFARDVVHSKLEPDYHQYCRQLRSMKSGTYKRVTEVGEKAFEMKSPISSPAFWLQVIAALGLTSLTSASEQEKLKSNSYQAFQFMRQTESAYAKMTKAG